MKHKIMETALTRVKSFIMIYFIGEIAATFEAEKWFKEGADFCRKAHDGLRKN